MPQINLSKEDLTKKEKGCNPKLYVYFVYPLDTLFIMTKDSGLRIRVERELREKFLETCKAKDKPAAQVLREFMRKYVAANNTDKLAANNKR